MFQNPESLNPVSLMVCTSAAIVTALQTCTALVMGQVFRPEDKWGPLSGLMKITHKASLNCRYYLFVFCFIFLQILSDTKLFK